MTHRIDTSLPWERAGLVLEGEDGGWGGFVLGDPCVVRDEDCGLWRMFVFALPPGHGQATCAGDPAVPGNWRFDGPLEFTNPEELGNGGAFKPFVVLDASRPGRAARFGNLFALLFVSSHESKVVRRAWSTSLAGPWSVEAGILLDRGRGRDFDAKHVDAVSAWLFADRGEVLVCYMGYPEAAGEQPLSPLGSAQGAALEDAAVARARGDATMAGTLPPPTTTTRKLGVLLPPSTIPGHWASGWVGGLQLLPGLRHRWVGLVNASPTAPRADDGSLSREEPPPSLGGFAVCDEEFPVRGWRWADDPLEWTGDVPPGAREAGEEVNFWRHHILVTDDGRLALFYNAGDYFHEKLFLKTGRAAS